MKEKFDSIKAALEDILKREGAFSKDQHTFAVNVIENNEKIAKEALTTLQELEKEMGSEEMVEKVIDAMGQHMPLIKDVITKIDPRTMQRITEVHEMPYFEMRKKYMPDLAKAAIKTILGK